MKLLMWILLTSVLLYSCDDNPSNPNNNNKDSLATFPLKIDNYWNFKGENNYSMVLKLKRKDSIPWVKSWWSYMNVSPVNKNAYYLEMKVIKGSFPEYTDYAIIEQDSAYLVCSNYHYFASTMPLNVYFKCFSIPKYLPKTQSFETDKFVDINRNLIYVDSTAVTYLENRMFGVINSRVYKIEYFSKIFTTSKELKKQQELTFEFADRIGFTKFMNFNLLNYNIEL